jgi:tRNA modification GTPase
MNNDTICAVATPAGGALAIIRVSGNKAIEIVSGEFSKNLLQAKGNTLHYGTIGRREAIDDVLVSVFRTPHSYTGEDSVEISCHGSSYIVQQILHLLVTKGCRMANPGEYTQRAYLNGKLDLSQAEAVADLIASTNRATHQMALSQLRGHFSSELSHLRDQLLKLTSLLELELDFSDHEELEFADRSELLKLAQTIDAHLTHLAQTFQTGQALKQGIPVAIVGKTNVGKSTLLNRLLKDERAIVSNIHGTTRDTIEDTIDINGVTFRFIDTAGIRQTTDQIEQIGIDRTYQAIGRASIVVWVIDEDPSEEEVKEIQQQCSGKSLIIACNKIDKGVSLTDSSRFGLQAALLQISAKYGQGIDELEAAIYQAADIPEIKENDTIVTNLRHYDALIRAQQSLQRVIDGMSAPLSLSGDLLAEDLRITLDILAEITGGQITTDEVLGNIFKHFCVGK